MINNLVNIIGAFFISYGSLSVFLMGIIEEVIFFVPSVLVFIMAGFFMIDASASFGIALWQSFFKIGIWGAFGVTVGSFFAYGLAYFGGKVIILKYGKYFGLEWEDVENLEKKFTGRIIDETTIFVLRAVPFFSIAATSVLCGITRIKWKEFAIFTFLGTIPRIVILSMVGWKVGEEYYQYASKISVIENYVLTGFAVLVLIFLVFLYIRKKKKNKIGENTNQRLK